MRARKSVESLKSNKHQLLRKVIASDILPETLKGSDLLRIEFVRDSVSLLLNGDSEINFTTQCMLANQL